MAALQGHAEATYNLVALCNARPSCVAQADTAPEHLEKWLGQAAAQGHGEASFQLGSLLLERGERGDDALRALLQGAKLGCGGRCRPLPAPCRALTAAVLSAQRAKPARGERLQRL